MKALPFKVPQGSKSSIRVDHDHLDSFYDTYHTHEELQLILIIRGSGSVYIGDKIMGFKEGDIFLLGQNLPHVFKNIPAEHGVESISIFFLPNFLGEGFLDLPESRSIAKFLSEVERGLSLNAINHPKIAKSIIQIESKNGLDRLLSLLEILIEIQHLKTIGPIASQGYRKPKRSEDGQKVNDVFDFLMANYENDISLEDVADIAHMSPTAFCRYFKQHTRKTYSRFLNEIRVGQACKGIIDGKHTISQICYNSGFNNISNFNRQFKKITGFTPSEYQNQHQ